MSASVTGRPLVLRKSTRRCLLEPVRQTTWLGRFPPVRLGRLGPPITERLCFGLRRGKIDGCQATVIFLVLLTVVPRHLDIVTDETRVSDRVDDQTAVRR
jgi:hypothetical protein